MYQSYYFVEGLGTNDCMRGVDLAFVIGIGSPKRMKFRFIFYL